MTIQKVEKFTKYFKNFCQKNIYINETNKYRKYNGYKYVSFKPKNNINLNDYEILIEKILDNKTLILKIYEVNKKKSELIKITIPPTLEINKNIKKFMWINNNEFQIILKE
jgi:hypothetical protein